MASIRTFRRSREPARLRREPPRPLRRLSLWLVVSPWVFGYAANSAMTASSVVTGALVMALAAWTLYVAGGFPHRRGTAH